MKELVGQTFSKVIKGNEDQYLCFIDMSGKEKYTLGHYQECCEDVHIEDIDNSLDVLENSEILEAEEVTSEDNLPGRDDYERWTFYKFRTQKEHITIRFYGGSNGYYSVGVDLIKHF